MDPDLLHKVVQSRRTEKVLAEVDEPTVISPELAKQNDPLVRKAVLSAGMAPFHYPRTKEIAEPWRTYHLWNADTNTLAKHLKYELGVETKEPKLLAASSAVVLITWLPEHPQHTTDKQRVIEEEHIAATSAMTQNLLLLLTAHGFGNYWSSGGILRTPELFTHLGISQNERLIGAIFIEYPEAANPSHERKAGALHKLRSDKWVTDLSLS